jgi:hypothetical protein
VSKPILEWRLGAVSIRVWAPDYIETVWPNGRSCPAIFFDDAQARQHAHEWGYGSDVRRMHLEHELTHTLLAQESPAKLPWSPVLYHVAGGAYVEDAERAKEEGHVVTVQRVMSRLAPLVEQYRKATNSCS